MPDAKLWSWSLRSRMVSAIPGRVGRMRVQESIPAASICPLFTMPPLYKMLEQFAGAGASIRRFALFGSYGTSWTAMVDAATEPSFRMMCSWSLPGSTSVGAGCPGTNVYTWGVQSASYSVMVPDVTMIRLWPGCVCQPVLATTPVVGLTGGQTLLCTYTSDGPFVFCNDSQTSPGNPRGSESFADWLKTANSPKVPVAMVVA